MTERGPMKALRAVATIFVFGALTATPAMATDSGVWSLAPTLHDRIDTRAFAIDPARDRIIMFGGFNFMFPEIPTYANEYYNDVWTYSLSERRWTPLETSGSRPAGRITGASVYDPVRDRLIVFGGYAPGRLNDLWELSLSGTPTWTQLAPSGTPPSARGACTAVYDPVRDRMVLFGGDDGAYRNDVFALSLAGTPAWSQLSISGTPPAGRFYPVSVYDAARDRLVLFGGVNGSGLLTDTWELSFAGSSWSPILASSPPPYGTGMAVLDPSRDRMLVYTDQNLWALDFAGPPEWHSVPAGTGPGHRTKFGMVRDPVRDRLVLFGSKWGYPSSDTWECPLDTPAWSRIDEGEPQFYLPSSRIEWSVLDSRRDRMLVMLRESGVARVMALTLDTFLWSTLNVIGTPPSPRSQPSVIYDRASDQVLVFGGLLSIGRTNETWALQLAGSPNKWALLSPSGTPPPARTGAIAILDTLDDLMVVAGGSTNAGDVNDVWALGLSGPLKWSMLATAGTPPATVRGSGIYDEMGHRLVAPTSSAVWFLSLDATPTWTSVATTSPTATCLYDAARNRLVGIEPGVQSPLRSWAFDLGSNTWGELGPTGSPPPSVSSYNTPLGVVFDRHRHRVVLFGMVDCSGFNTCYSTNSTHLLDFGSATVSVENVEPSLGSSLLLSIAPSPARESQTFTFRLAAGDVARSLEIYTVDGRRVWHASLGGRASGVQVVEWDGRTKDRGRAPASVYFARLITHSGTSTKRFIRF